MPVFFRSMESILWEHLSDLVQRDIQHGGLRIMPKHGYEHINLTPFSKMRVDLAAQVSAELCLYTSTFYVCTLYSHLYMQVVSEIVTKALQLTGGPEATETVCFISILDKFFDCQCSQLHLRSL